MKISSKRLTVGWPCHTGTRAWSPPVLCRAMCGTQDHKVLVGMVREIRAACEPVPSGLECGRWLPVQAEGAWRDVFRGEYRMLWLLKIWSCKIQQRNLSTSRTCCVYNSMTMSTALLVAQCARQTPPQRRSFSYIMVLLIKFGGTGKSRVMHTSLTNISWHKLLKCPPLDTVREIFLIFKISLVVFALITSHQGAARTRQSKVC